MGESNRGKVSGEGNSASGEVYKMPVIHNPLSPSLPFGALDVPNSSFENLKLMIGVSGAIVTMRLNRAPLERVIVAVWCSCGG